MPHPRLALPSNLSPIPHHFSRAHRDPSIQNKMREDEPSEQQPPRPPSDTAIPRAGSPLFLPRELLLRESVCASPHVLSAAAAPTKLWCSACLSVCAFETFAGCPPGAACLPACHPQPFHAPFPDISRARNIECVHANPFSRRKSRHTAFVQHPCMPAAMLIYHPLLHPLFVRVHPMEHFISLL